MLYTAIIAGCRNETNSAASGNIFIPKGNCNGAPALLQIEKLLAMNRLYYTSRWKHRTQRWLVTSELTKGGVETRRKSPHSTEVAEGGCGDHEGRAEQAGSLRSLRKSGQEASWVPPPTGGDRSQLIIRLRDNVCVTGLGFVVTDADVHGHILPCGS